MRPKFGVEDQRKAYKDDKIHFPRDMGFACLHYRLDLTITLWFCSTRWDQVLRRRTYAHFFPRELQQLHVRDIRSETQGTSTQFQERGKRPHCRALSRAVDSPLEHTSEGNLRVEYFDKVQNET